MKAFLLTALLIFSCVCSAKANKNSFTKADKYNFKLIEKKINSFTRLNQMANLFVPLLPKKEQAVWQKRMLQWKDYKAPRASLKGSVITYQADSIKIVVDYSNYRNGNAHLNGILFTYNNTQSFTQQVDFIANQLYRKSRSSGWIDSILIDQADAAAPAGIWAYLLLAGGFTGGMLVNEFSGDIINILKRETCDGLSENFNVPVDSVLSCPAESLISQVRNSFRPQNITCNIERVLDPSHAETDAFAKDVSFLATNTSSSAIEIFGPQVQVSGRTSSSYQSNFTIEFSEPRTIAKTDEELEPEPTRSLYISTNQNGEITDCVESSTAQSCMSVVNEYAEIRDWITSARTVLHTSFNDCRSRASAIEERLRNQTNPHRVCDGSNCIPDEDEIPVSP